MTYHQHLRPLESKLTLTAIALGAVTLVSAVAWLLVFLRFHH